MPPFDPFSFDELIRRSMQNYSHITVTTSDSTFTQEGDSNELNPVSLRITPIEDNPTYIELQERVRILEIVVKGLTDIVEDHIKRTRPPEFNRDNRKRSVIIEEED